MISLVPRKKKERRRNSDTAVLFEEVKALAINARDRRRQKGAHQKEGKKDSDRQKGCPERTAHKMFSQSVVFCSSCLEACG